MKNIVGFFKWYGTSLSIGLVIGIVIFGLVFGSKFIIAKVGEIQFLIGICIFILLPMVGSWIKMCYELHKG